MQPPEAGVVEERREESSNDCSQLKNKGSESLQGSTKHFALGFLVKRTSTSPNRKPADPESHPIWCHQQIELVLSSGLVKKKKKYSQEEPIEDMIENKFLSYFEEGFCSSSRSAEQSLFRNAFSEDLRIGCVLAVGGQNICSGGCQVCKGCDCSKLLHMIAEHPVWENRQRGTGVHG